MDDAPPPFDAIYEHAGFVRAMAVGVLGGDAEVEDVVQETWLVAMRSAPRRPASLRSWLGSVSRRLALRTRRSAARRGSKHGRGARPEGTPSVVELAAREEVRRRLVQAVLELDEPYRAAILLRYVEDLPVREVAARQGVPLDTAKTRLRRGLERLRERLDAEHRGDRKAWAFALVPFAAPPAAVAAPLSGLVAAGFLAFAATGLLAAWQGWGPFAREAEGPDLLAKMRASIERWGGALRPAEPEVAPLAGRPSQGRGAISGVVRHGWDPVAGARVEVRERVGGAATYLHAPSPLGSWLSPWLASRTVAVATTDAGGRYRAQGVGEGLFQVVAFAPDGQAASATAWLGAQGASVGRDLEVSPRREGLAGRIAHADGRPWVGLVMAHRADIVWAAFGLPPEAGPVRTDAEGRFRIAGLDAGAWVLVGVDPGVEVILDRPRAVPGAGDVDWTIPSHGPDRALRVLADDDGSPIAGAEVFWAATSGEGEYLARVRRLVSDDAGSVDLPGAAGEGTRAEAVGFVPRSLSRDRLGPPPPVEIRLARGARIGGHVRRADGTPVAGARVRFEALEASGSRGDAGEAVTDASGRYEIVDLGPLEGVVRVVGDDVCSPGAPPGAADDPGDAVVALNVGEARTKDLVAILGPRVEGRVSRADGTPVAGAVVVLSLPGETHRGRWTRRDPTTATDASGRYSAVVPWPAEGARVTADSEDDAHGEGVAKTSPGGTLRADVVLGVADPRRLEVRVREEGSGLPVVGARASVHPASPDPSGWSLGSEAFTDASGVAHLTRLPRGPLRVQARSPLMASWSQPVEIAAPCEGEGLCAVTIEVPAHSTIEGRVTFESGEVAALPVHLRPVGRAPGPSVDRTATSDARGAFRFEGLPSGAFELSAERQVGAVRQRAVRTVNAGDTGADLELRPVAAPSAPAAHDVRIVGPDGAPVPAGQFAEYRVAESQGGEARYAGSGSFANGRAQRRREPGATYYCEAFGAETGSKTPLPYGAVLAGPFGPDDGEVVLRMPPERTIEGRVVGPDGAPVEGVLLEAWPTKRVVGDDGPSGDLPSDRSDAQGRFRLRRLGSFRYRVTATPPSRFAKENVLELESGARDAVVTLRVGASPSILVLDPDGHPAPDVEVRARPARFERVNGVEVPVAVPLAAHATTDADGRARLLGLDPGVPYTLSTYFSTQKLAALPFSQARWLPVDTTIRLERSYRIAGVVRDPAGRPVHPAVVLWLSQPPNGWTGDAVKDDGSFAFGGLPDGETRLQVMLGSIGEYGAPPAEFPARAGDEHVELVVDPGLTLELHVLGWPGEATGGAAPTAVLWRRGAPGGRYARAWIGADGIATFHGVEAGSDLELVVRSLPDGRTAHRTGVRSDAGRLEVRLEPGGSVEGRLLLPSGATQPSVFLSIPSGTSLAHGTVEPDGHFVIRGVPEGSWQIWANARMPGEVDGHARFASGTAEAKAGQTVEIVLKP